MQDTLFAMEQDSKEENNKDVGGRPCVYPRKTKIRKSRATFR